jgi:hypothetical protein
MPFNAPLATAEVKMLVGGEEITLINRSNIVSPTIFAANCARI